MRSFVALLALVFVGTAFAAMSPANKAGVRWATAWNKAHSAGKQIVGINCRAIDRGQSCGVLYDTRAGHTSCAVVSLSSEVARLTVAVPCKAQPKHVGPVV